MKYYIIFFDETQKEISAQTYEEIMNESVAGAIGKEIGGSFYKFSDIRKILNESDYREQYGYIKSDYHQPYENFIGKGMAGVIKSVSETSHLEALARGLKKAKESFKGKPTPNIDELLKLARMKYLSLSKTL